MATTTRRARARRRRHPRTRVWREAASGQLGAHASDAAALALAVGGIVAALGIVSDVAGPLGRAVDVLASVLLGSGRALVPVALLVAAGLLLARRGDDEATGSGVRVGVGLGALVWSTAGILHLGNGSPDSAGLEPLREAGGVLGALAAAPLEAGAGRIGAGIVLGALALLGALLVWGIRLRELGAGLLAGWRFVWSRAQRLGERSVGPDPDPTQPTLYDQRADEAWGAAAEPDDGAWEDEDDAAEWDDEAAETDDEEDDEEEEEEEDEDDDGLAAEAWDDDGEWDDEDEEEEDEDDEDSSGIVLGEGEPVLDMTVRDASAGEVASGARPGGWKLPPGTVLKRSLERELDERLIDVGGDVLERTLQEFGVDARLVGRTVGPTVTRYELELAPGVKVKGVTALNHDIAYAMASPDVRILAPIPGRSAIGVEVPNKQRQLVTLGDILASAEATEATRPLEVGLGRDIAGRAVIVDLATMPHLLIAGATGAGKSSCINSIVTSILMRSTPEEVRLILVDPKRVELGAYNGLPHLLTEVVTNPKKAANALDWAVREMDLRYDLLAEVGVRDILGYNAMLERGDLPSADDPDPETGKAYEPLPYILVVVDELNDLMMVAARDVESSICRIAQMARAVGIHLVIATQRPSVDAITGVIKANVPSRLAFSVSSLADSRVILDQAGAEKLIGQGDMLLMTASSSRAQRIQGAWVDEECVAKVASHWKRQAREPRYVDGVADEAPGKPGSGAAGGADEDDELLAEAMELVVRSGLGSTSMLQRKLRVGFARAGRLMDLLERKGVVGPSHGSKARDVLMTVDELEGS